MEIPDKIWRFVLPRLNRLFLSTRKRNTCVSNVEPIEDYVSQLLEASQRKKRTLDPQPTNPLEGSETWLPRTHRRQAPGKGPTASLLSAHLGQALHLFKTLLMVLSPFLAMYFFVRYHKAKYEGLGAHGRIDRAA